MTKVANELSSWPLPCVDMSWGWPHVKYARGYKRGKTYINAS